MTMLDELRQQPEVTTTLLGHNRSRTSRVRELASGCTHVVVAARGTSDNAARYAQYVWGSRNRLAVGLTTPSLFGPLESPPSLSGALVVGISQSGRSPDLVAVLAEAAEQGRPTLVITNEPGSPLATQADLVIDLCAGPELAVAATKTYTAELVAVALVSEAMAGRENGLGSLADSLSRALETAVPSLEALVEAQRCVVVGRGYHLSTVHEWALKLQELTYLLAQPFSAADFLHGPVAVVEEGLPVLAVATAGPTGSEMSDLVTEMSQRGAHVITMTDSPGPDADTIAIPEVDPWLSPIVAAPALQLFAYDLAVARGLDPDTPRGLSKVTLTE